MRRATCFRPGRLSAKSLPVSHEDCLALRQKADANFAACLATSDRFFDRRHPCDEADAALDVTNELDPFVLEFLERPMSDEASSASCPFTPSSAEGGGSSAEHSPPPVCRRKCHQNVRLRELIELVSNRIVCLHAVCRDSSKRFNDESFV